MAILINACDYKPLYSTNKTSDFNISSLETIGDRNINNFLKRGLNVYKNPDSEKNYDISLNTFYSKNILVKDKTANTTDYKLSVIVEMNIVEHENNSDDIKEKKITFSEELNIKKDTNNFSQANYENLSKINMAEMILDKIILFLNNSV